MQHDAIDNDQYDGDTYNPMDADDDQLSHSMVNPQETTLRRSTRVRQQSTRYSPNEYVLLTDGGEPEDIEEAMENADKQQWLHAMKDKMKSLYDNQTFELVKLSKGKRALKNRWIYRLKQEKGSSTPRYKARLVVKGFNQKKGLILKKFFCPWLKCLLSKLC